MADINKSLEQVGAALNQIRDEVAKSLETLGASGKITDNTLLGVIAAYTAKSRAYHGLDHAKDVAETDVIEGWGNGKVAETPKDAKIADALRTLAGLGHDSVYYVVDGNKVPEVALPTMKHYFEGYSDGQPVITLKNEVQQDRKAISEIAQKIFGFEKKENFNIADRKQSEGFNEFASALVIMDILQDAGVEEKYLAMVAQTIAATVPFIPEENGKSHPEVLRERLTELSTTRDIDLTQDEVNLSTRLAVDVGNKDVSGFAGGGKETREDRLQYFLENTWRLMHESTLSLRAGDPTAEEYFGAMKGNAGFVNVVMPSKVEDIFHQITIEGKAFPPEEDFIKLQNTAREVLGDGGVYLNAKVASAGVVLALQKIAGVDKPLKDLMQGVQLSETTLPKGASEQDITVSALLNDRGEDPVTRFDVARSPIAEFMFNNASLTLYKLTADKNTPKEELTRGHLMKDLTTQAIAMQKGDITAQQYLESLSAIIGRDNSRALIENVGNSIATKNPAAADKIRETLKVGRSAA